MTKTIPAEDLPKVLRHDPLHDRSEDAPRCGPTTAMRVAVVGAGLAGATCARMLADAGCEVLVFDKSRGVGGRLATRRASVTLTHGVSAGHTVQVYFDHGAPAWHAQDPDFLALLQRAEQDGVVQPWLANSDAMVALPDMPALCRWLLRDITVHTHSTVQGLRRGNQAWHLQLTLPDQSVETDPFDAVVVAIPPAQAATLWAAHHAQWARQAAAITMEPCWTLMAITPQTPANATPARPALQRPAAGPLALVVHQSAKPGRQTLPGHDLWVAHAHAEWSMTHLETPAETVQADLQAALAAALGHPVEWTHAVVHRWRFAQVPSGRSTEPAGCAWDATRALGACGDYWGGGGVEGAWRSGQTLARQIVALAATPRR